MSNQAITVWVCFNADRMMKDQTNHTICRLYDRIIKYIKQVYLEIWHGKEWFCFLLNLAPVFSPIYLFSWACTYFYLFGSLLICESLFLFMIVCENLFFFVWAFDKLFFSVKFKFLNLCENKAAYEPHHLRCTCYHQNMIMVFSWLHMFQFYVFYYVSFSPFVSDCCFIK